MGKKHLTLNIGASTVSLAEFEETGNGLVLVNYGTAHLAASLDSGSADTILSPAILEIVRERGIKPGPVSVSVSGQMVFPRFAAIPFAGGADKFEQMIRYEIEQNIPFPIDEMICDRQVLGDTENGDKSVMIVAAKTDQIEALTSAIMSAGFTPTLVDVAPIALTNALKWNLQEAEDECRVILDIGAKTTSLVITEGDKLYNRSIPVAGNTITKEIAQALGCSLEEAEQIKLERGYVALGGVVEDEDELNDRVSKVCRAVMTRLHAEISRSINFYRSQQGGGVPARLYLTGGTALLPQIDRFFSEGLQLEVEYFNPFQRVGTGPSIDAEALEADAALLAAATGVAVHAAGAAQFAINLLPPSLLKARADVAKIPFAAAGAVALIAALAMVLVTFNHKSEVTRVSVEALESRVTQLRGMETKIKSAVEKQEEAVVAADEIRDLCQRRGVAVAKLNALRLALGTDMWIEKWEGDRVTIRGWSDDLKALVAKSKSVDGVGKMTAPQIVAERLKASSAVDASSVQIAEMCSLGKDDALQQFVVVVKFGKGERK